jgi:hypothetical protein
MMRCRAGQPLCYTPSTVLISVWRYQCCDAELAYPVDPLYYAIPRRPVCSVGVVLVLASFTCHLHTIGRGHVTFAFLLICAPFAAATVVGLDSSDRCPRLTRACRWNSRAACAVLIPVHPWQSPCPLLSFLGILVDRHHRPV